MFGGSGFSLTKAQLQAEESKGKVLEAVNFLVRGVRLLGSDAQNSVRLVTKAALGEPPDESLEDGPRIAPSTPADGKPFARMHAVPSTHPQQCTVGQECAAENRMVGPPP